MTDVAESALNRCLSSYFNSMASNSEWEAGEGVGLGGAADI